MVIKTTEQKFNTSNDRQPLILCDGSSEPRGYGYYKERRRRPGLSLVGSGNVIVFSSVRFPS